MLDMIVWCFVQHNIDNVPWKKPYRTIDLGIKLKLIKNYEVGKSVKLRRGVGRHDGNYFEVDKGGRNIDWVIEKTEGAHRASECFYTIIVMGDILKVAEYP